MTRRHVAAALIVGAGLVWLYGGVLSSLVQQWASDDDYSHGFLVVPLAAFVAWERRARLRAAPLHLANTNLEVAEACSGIRSLASLLMLAVVLGYFTESRIAARVALALAAVPIAILANASRVAGTGMASHWLGRAAAEGFFHIFSGWLMFVVAFAGLIAVQRLMARIHLRPLRPGAVSVGAG